MPQYTSSQSSSRFRTTAVFDTETNTVTYTVSAVGSGQTATVTVPESTAGNSTSVVTDLFNQLKAQGYTGAPTGLATTLATTDDDVHVQQGQAAAAARRANAPAPDAPNPPVPLAETANGPVPVVGQNATAAASQATTETAPPVTTSPASPEGDPATTDLPQAEAEERPSPTLGPEDVQPLDAGAQAQLEFEQEQERERLKVENYQPEPVPPSKAGPVGTPYDDDGNLNPGWTLNETNDPVFVGGTFVEPATAASAAASREAATKLKAKDQATLSSRYRTSSNNDWRVRLSLAPSSQYLYNAPSNPGILAPLKATNGVIFPYVPTISTTYSANYEAYDLIHSNYRGLYYKNSRVGDISIRGMFTAQDTAEASYLLAVIHFFRSVTKMFYGQDPERGTPPPLVYLSGFGEFQFNGHACVVNSFNYTLPNDVDYIKANNPNNYGTNLFNRRTPTQSGFGGTSFAGAARLANALLPKGAQSSPPAGTNISNSVNNNMDSTYVPTKMEIDISLIPVQTRNQVSKVFSLRDFANGNGLKGGFW